MTIEDKELSIPGADAYHMPSADFRALGHELIDFIADYHEGIESYPVLSQVEPGEVFGQISAVPPEHGDGLASLIDDMHNIILPGITHWQSPRFFGYFPANASAPSILGELLSSGLGVNGMLWATSPAATELETRVLDWLVDLCDLPDRFASGGSGGGVMLDSASSATLTAMVAARHRSVGHQPAPGLRAYTSSQAHSSVLKGMRVAGFADEQLRVISTDKDFAMDSNVLAAAMSEDAAAGLVPFFVVATAGTTSSSAFDPVVEIAKLAAAHGAWLHVDSAYAGSAAVAPELRFVNEGIDQADSYSFNPHKWLLTNFDATAFWVADRQALTSALSIVPEYLKNEASDAGLVIDYRDWQIPLGRRFRALKLWMVIRWYGAEGLRAYIREHVALAQELAKWVDDHPSFERVAPAPLSLVCFAHTDGDDRSTAILEQINREGRHHLTHTVLDGRYVIRVAIGSVKTGRSHVEDLWQDLVALA